MFVSKVPKTKSLLQKSEKQNICFTMRLFAGMICEKLLDKNELEREHGHTSGVVNIADHSTNGPENCSGPQQEKQKKGQKRNRTREEGEEKERKMQSKKERRRKERMNERHKERITKERTKKKKKGKHFRSTVFIFFSAMSFYMHAHLEKFCFYGSKK